MSASGGSFEIRMLPGLSTVNAPFSLEPNSATNLEMEVARVLRQKPGIE